MNKHNDFEIIPSTRATLLPQSPHQDSTFISPRIDRLAGAAADNFGRILDVACAITEIQQMKAQADISVALLREKRLMLAEETKNYVAQIEAETKSTVEKMDVIRRMMEDYYRFGQDKLSGTEFSKIISDVMDHIGEF